MTMNRICSLAIALVFLLPLTANAFPATVLEVLDGDTIVVAPNGDTTAPLPIRMSGIDAPELKQPYGKQAKEWVVKRAPVGSQVEIVSYSDDKYRRAIGLVQVAGKGHKLSSINGELVRQGLAWVYDGYVSGKMSKLWNKWQREAKKAKRGLWADSDALEPWKWRKANKKNTGKRTK